MVSDNVAISRALPTAFAERLKRVGVQYHKRLACQEAVAAAKAAGHGPAPYNTWQNAFQTDDRAKALSAVDPTMDSLDWREEDGSLSWTSLRPAFHRLVCREITPSAARVWTGPSEHTQAVKSHCIVYHQRPPAAAI